MEPLEEAGVAVPFRAINSVRSGCALHSRSRCCFQRGRLFCWFWGLLRHLNQLRYSMILVMKIQDVINLL